MYVYKKKLEKRKTQKKGKYYNFYLLTQSMCVCVKTVNRDFLFQAL